MTVARGRCGDGGVVIHASAKASCLYSILLINIARETRPRLVPGKAKRFWSRKGKAPAHPTCLMNLTGGSFTTSTHTEPVLCLRLVGALRPQGQTLVAGE